MNSAWLGLRALLFYAGYAVSLVIHACISLLVGMFLPLRKRYRFILRWNQFALWWLKICCGVKVVVEGRENVPAGSFVVLSNHQSPWETLALYTMFVPICATLKRELLKIPFFGWALAMLKPIAIDRGKRTSARQTLLKQGKERLAMDISVLVFPEGTRVNPGEIRKFTTGGADLAINAGVPVLPVAHNAGHCWPARKLIKYPGTVRVRIGKPIHTAGREPRELTEHVERWVREQVAAMDLEASATP